MGKHATAASAPLFSNHRNGRRGSRRRRRRRRLSAPRPAAGNGSESGGGSVWCSINEGEGKKKGDTVASPNNRSVDCTGEKEEEEESLEAGI